MDRPHHRRCTRVGRILGLAVACISLIASEWARAEPVVARWANESGGNWFTGDNWSTAPYAPRNDIPAGRTYHAIIDRPTGQDGIGLDGNLTLDAITLDAPDADMYHRRGVVQTVAGPMDLRNGTWHMGLASPGGARIRDTVITSTAVGGNGRIMIHDDGYLENVTLGAPVVVQHLSSSHLIVERGLNFASGGRIVTDVYSFIDFRGVARVDGPGEIIFGGGTVDRGGYVRASNEWGTSPATIAFGPEMAIRTDRGAGTLLANVVNEGVVSAQTHGSIRIAGHFDNRGIVQAVNGGRLDVNLGPDARLWRNHGGGVLRLDAGSSLHLHGRIAEEALGSFERNGGTVVIHGDWDNLGRTVRLDAFDGGWEIGDPVNLATLRGGTYIAAGEHDTMRIPRGWKARFGGGVRVDADIEVGVEGQLRIADEFTLNGTLLMRGGAKLLSDAAGITGQGVIVFDDTATRYLESSGVTVLPVSSRPVGLRIGPGIVLEGRAGQVVVGTADDGSSVRPGPIVNKGKIAAAAEKPMWLASRLENAGSIEVSGAGGFVSRAELHNDGIIHIETGSTFVNRGAFVQGSTGTIGGRGTWRQLEGSSLFEGRQEWQPGSRMDIEGGSLVLRSHAGADGVALSLTVGPGAVTHFETRQHLRSLAIDGAGSVADGAGAIYTLQFSLGSDGRFDLADNELIVDRESSAVPGPDPVRIRQWIRRGYAEGAWNGPGLTTSVAIKDQAKALGYATAEQLGLESGEVFAGQTLIHPKAALVAVTLFGDSTLDGTVDLSDLDSYLRGLNGPGGDWVSGDYNYDGLTDIPGDFPLFMRGFRVEHDDAHALINAINGSALAIEQRAALVALVPEPSASALLVLVILCTGNRRVARVRRSFSCR